MRSSLILFASLHPWLLFMEFTTAPAVVLRSSIIVSLTAVIRECRVSDALRIFKWDRLYLPYEWVLEIKKNDAPQKGEPLFLDITKCERRHQACTSSISGGRQTECEAWNFF